MTPTDTIPDADLESAMRKIRGLLAKAEGTDNTAEAEAFFAKAAELMDTYRLDEAKVRGTASGGIVRDEINMKQYRHQRATVALLSAVARHYGVVATSKGSNTAVLGLHGEQSDIDAVKMMVASLVVQRERAMWKQVVPANVHATTFHNSFCYGFAVEVSKRLQAIRDAAKSQASAGGDGMALEVFDRWDRVMESLGNLKKGSMNKANLNKDGLDRGSAAGANADLGQRRFDAGPRAIGRA